MPEVMAGARQWITLAPVTPLRGGVVSVANVIDTSGPELMGAIADTDACATAEEWDEWCTTSPVAAKLFEDADDVIEGDPFVVYTGIACDLQRIDEGNERARARLSLAESRAVDFKVGALLDTGATDLGGPFPVAQAIGAAEAYAATVYGGVPTLLIPRQFIPCVCACGILTANLDGSLTTVSGSMVAPLTAAVTEPVTDAGTLYVTGRITLLRSSVTSISVPQQILDGGSFSPARALAERVYVPMFDCFTAKVDVSCSA